MELYYCRRCGAKFSGGMNTARGKCPKCYREGGIHAYQDEARMQRHVRLAQEEEKGWEEWKRQHHSRPSSSAAPSRPSRTKPRSTGGPSKAGWKLAGALFLIFVVCSVALDKSSSSGGRTPASGTISQCGRGPAPGGVENWPAYSCMDRTNYGRGFQSSCLNRSAYSDTSGEGCPGNQLCCPPRTPELEPQPSSTSKCGIGVNPGFTGWSSYRCMSSEEYGGGFRSECLRRNAYSDIEGEGCPGSQLCCPTE
jgi:hypothetical protein